VQKNRDPKMLGPLFQSWHAPKRHFLVHFRIPILSRSEMPDGQNLRPIAACCMALAMPDPIDLRSDFFG
jgi:hypothetical protein